MSVIKTIEKIKSEIDHKNHKLIILVDKTNKNDLLIEKIQTLNNVDVLNLNFLLTKILVTISKQQQSNPIEIIEEILSKNCFNDVILFSNINILFDENLKWNPLEILKKLSRKYFIIVLWNGKFNEHGLEYASHPHLEHTQYSIRDLDEILIIE